MYSGIKYWVIDVDGTMTDGGIYYDSFGNEIKKYNTKDGIGIKMLSKMGMKTIVLTGRESNATERRMTELGVDFLFQNIKNKKEFLENYLEKNKILKEELAYIGDDLNDIYAMNMAAFKACPADACNEILECVDYVSTEKGGNGAVRDIVCYFLKQTGQWDVCMKCVYEAGI